MLVMSQNDGRKKKWKVRFLLYDSEGDLTEIDLQRARENFYNQIQEVSKQLRKATQDDQLAAQASELEERLRGLMSALVSDTV
jgi:hypothetical protein